MFKYVLIILLIISQCVTGCSFVKRHQAVSPDDDLHEYDLLIKEGKIIQRDKLEEGGAILIIPFNAGENVSATDDLDRVSLNIVKGVSTVFMDTKSSPFEVLVSENANEAEFIIYGHIMEMREDGSNIKWLSKKKKFLSVKGEMIDIKTNQVVMHFSHNLGSVYKEDTFALLGFNIGTDIGNYLLSVVKN